MFLMTPSHPLWNLKLKTPIKNAYPTAAPDATFLLLVLAKRQMHNGTDLLHLPFAVSLRF